VRRKIFSGNILIPAERNQQVAVFQGVKFSMQSVYAKNGQIFSAPMQRICKCLGRIDKGFGAYCLHLCAISFFDWKGNQAQDEFREGAEDFLEIRLNTPKTCNQNLFLTNHKCSNL
jgi:hypothetical protein